MNPEDLGTIVQFQTVGEGAIRPKLKYWLPNEDSYSLQQVNSLATTNPISWNNSLEWQANEIDSLLMPKIAGISVLKRGKVRRAKLYYLRDRRGKSARIVEKIQVTKKDNNPKKVKTEVKEASDMKTS